MQLLWLQWLLQSIPMWIFYFGYSKIIKNISDITSIL
jgi:hypothetical protein